jgi:predicted amidophosphoribosyltransferase
MNRAALRLLDLLYPNRCDCCGQRIRYDAAVCAACREQLTGLRLPYAAWAAHQKEIFPWADGAAVWRYADAARSGVLAMKDGMRGFGRYAGAMLAKEVRERFPAESLTCVTWTPMGRARRRRQGYAHAELLGKTVARELHLRARGDLLTETDTGTRQHTLSRKQRIEHAKRFLYTGAAVRGETVLLCDDILATGSTLRRCTELLLDAGAERVYIAVIAAAIMEDSPTD